MNKCDIDRALVGIRPDNHPMAYRILTELRTTEADRKLAGDLEAQLEKALTERDDYHDMADQLAEQIAAITDQEIGEHSSGNNPWQNAMLAADEWIAKDIWRLTDGVDRKRMVFAGYQYQGRDGAWNNFMDLRHYENTVADGTWPIRAIYTTTEQDKAAGPSRSEPVAYLDLGVGGYMDLGTDLTDEQLAALPKGRHMLAIVGTYGVDGYTEAAPQPAEPVKHKEEYKPEYEYYEDGKVVWTNAADAPVVKSAETVKVDAEASVPSDDALDDALSNLEHDNYEQSYSGYKNRQADIALIRTTIEAHRKRRGEPSSLAEVWRINADEAEAYGQPDRADTLRECAAEVERLAAPQPAEPTPAQIRRSKLRADPIKAAALDRARERIAAELANSAEPVKVPSDDERAAQGLPPYNPRLPTDEEMKRLTENGRKAWGKDDTEPARVPSDDLETLRMMRAEYDPGNGPMSALKAVALDAAIAALLARYGNNKGESNG